MITVTSGQSLTIDTQWNDAGAAPNTYVSGSGSLIANPDGSYVYLDGKTVLSGIGVANGGGVVVNSGGVLSASTISGSEYVSAGGVDDSNSMFGSAYIDSGGQVRNGIMDGSETVAAGAGIYDVTLGATRGAASEDLFGSANQTFLYLSASMTVEAGGVADHTSLTDNSVLNVQQGGVAHNVALTIFSSATVAAGGYADQVQVSVDCNLDVAGEAEQVQVYQNGTLLIESGATVNTGVAYAGAGVSGLVLSAGSAADIKGATMIGGFLVHAGAYVSLDVAAGASISGWVANGYYYLGNTYNVYGQSTQDQLLSGAVENVYGSAGGVAVGSGCTLSAMPGGEADQVTVAGGGTLYYAGGAVSGGMVMSGGMISGLLLSDASTVIQGLTAVDGVMLAPGAMVALEIAAGGVLSGFSDNGQYELVDNGGLITNFNVGSGNIVDVYGSAGNFTVNSGGQLIAEDGSLLGSGTIAAGGALSGLVLSTSASQNDAQTGFSVDGLTVLNGGSVSLEVVSGTAIDHFHETGQIETVDSGATVTADLVDSGGQQQVYGVANASVIGSGGTGNVNAGAVQNGVTVLNGGVENIAAGATVTNLVIDSGGMAALSGGDVSGGSVASGGMLTGLVLSAGSAAASNGAVTIDGIAVASGAAVSLEVAAGAGISGFVLAANQTENVDAGAASYADQIASGASDYIDGAASSAVVANGGSLYVDAGGTVLAPTIQAGGALTVSAGGMQSGGSIQAGGYDIVNSGGSADGVSIAGGTLEYNDAVTAGQTVSFNGGGTLMLDQPGLFQGVISGFTGGDTLDLSNISAGSVTLGDGNLLSVSDGQGNVYTLQLDPAAAYGGGTFFLTGDGQSGSDIRFFSGQAGQISAAGYDARTGVLTLNGAHLAADPAGGAVSASGFSISGDGGSYTLSSGSTVAAHSNARHLSLQLSTTDQQAVNALLDGNGSHGQHGAAFTLHAAAGWQTQAAAASVALTVGHYQAPHLSAASYDQATGQFTLTGKHLVNASNTLDMQIGGTPAALLHGHFSATLDGRGTVLTLTPDTAATTAAIDAALSGSQQLLLAAGWDGGGSRAGKPALSITASAEYDAGKGQITVGGNWYSSFVGRMSAVVAGDFTVAVGDRHLTLSASDKTLGGTINLSAGEQQTLNAMLDNNGTASAAGTAFSLSAAAGWLTDYVTVHHWVSASAFSSGLVVQGIVHPTLTAAGYAADSGQLTLSGSDLGHSATLSGLTLVSANGSLTLGSGDSIGAQSAGSLVVNLSSADAADLAGLLSNHAGLSLNAAAGWESGSETAQTGLPVTVSSLMYPQQLAGGLDAVAAVTATGGRLVYLSLGAGGIDRYDLHTGKLTALNAGGLPGNGGLAVAGGTLYAADPAGHAVDSVGAGGVHGVVTGLARPVAVAAAAGSLYIADAGNGGIEQYQLASHSLHTLATVTSGTLQAIAADSRGDLYFTAGGTLLELARGAAAPVVLAAGLSAPAALAVDAAGNVFVADAGSRSLLELAAGTTSLQTLAAIGLGTPSALALDSQGNLLIGDSGSRNLEKLSHGVYLLHTPLASLETHDQPPTIDSYWANTGQIELSKAVFTAFAGQKTLTAAEFSTVQTGSGQTPLSYDAGNGGLYYNTGKAVLEIAVIGVDGHPPALSLGDFRLVG